MNIAEKVKFAYIIIVRWFRRFVIAVFRTLLFSKDNNVKKVLINRDGAFGDIIVSLPAIKLIREKYPSATINLFSVSIGGISFNDIPLEPGLLDNVFVTDKPGRQALLQKLSQDDYDLFIQLPQNLGLYKSLRNMLIVRLLLKIKNGFGWDEGRVKAFMDIQKKYCPPPRETERFLTTLKQHDIDGDISYPLQETPPTNIDLEELKNQGKKVAAFLIGGKLQPKKWPLPNWSSLAKLLGDDTTIIIIGGEGEYNEAEFIAKDNNHCINLCGKFGLDELFYVFKQIDFAISLDTGAMHLCDAAATKQIVLFSTRDLTDKWQPGNSNSVVIENVLPCSFCLKTSCKNNICMINISAEQVANIAKAF